MIDRPADENEARPKTGVVLRKLMLWVAVWLAYLNAVVRFAMPLYAAAALTAYLGILVPVRIKWGYARGLRIALLGTVVAFFALVETAIIAHYFTGQSDSLIHEQWVLCPAFFLGLFFGAFGFVFVHILVVVVDWIHWLM